MPSETKVLADRDAGDGRSAHLKPIGLRQRHKIAKQERISTAALLLFGRQGYDGTTLRDIAREADVALGTLSLYARDKRDLVLMIFNKVIPPLLEHGSRNTRASQALADNLVAFFEPCYVAYAGNLVLYRTVLGQIYNGPSSVIAEENDAIRIRLMAYLAHIIGQAVTTGECRPDLDTAVHARAIFYIYFTAVRVWLFRDQPVPEHGLAELRLLYEHHIRGMAAA